MTKTRFIIWTVSLIAAITLSSCAPAVTSTPNAPTEALPATAAPTDLAVPIVPEAVSITSTQVQVVQVVPTSRGPNLEATDPTTVNLASGQLQLVEFFRFT